MKTSAVTTSEPFEAALSGANGWSIGGLEFQHPVFFVLLALIPLLMLLRGAKGPRAALIFSSTALTATLAKLTQSKAGRLLFFLRLVTLTLLIIAIARPRLGHGHSEIESSGIDIMLAIDTSGSMAALDFATERNIVTRLDVVKEVVAEFIEKRPQDRIGLIVFAKQPYLISPPTLNHQWLISNLERIELGLIDGSQTGIGTAIGMCTNRMREINAKSRIVVLLTDGEENSHILEPIPAAEAAKAFGIKIYTIAAGHTGEVFQASLNEKGEIQYDRRRRVVGRYMQSNVDEVTLQKVAEITSGQYFRATDRAELSEIYTEIDQLEKTEIKLRHYSSYKELFLYFALPALGLLLIEQLLCKTRFRRIP